MLCQTVFTASGSLTRWASTSHTLMKRINREVEGHDSTRRLGSFRGAHAVQFRSTPKPSTHRSGCWLDCDKNPELNVHPLNDPVVDITCTVKNPSSFQESISVEKEWEGLEVDMMLEEDTFDLGPGEETSRSFTGKPASPELSYDFTLNAVVTNVAMLDVQALRPMHRSAGFEHRRLWHGRFGHLRPEHPHHE